MTWTVDVIAKAVVAALKADSSVGAVVGDRIYTDVPQDVTYPYALVSISSSDYSAKDFTGMDHTVQINGYSKEPSLKEASDICAACYNVLNRQESGLTLDSGTLTHIHFLLSDVFRSDEDGVTWEGVAQFRAVVT